MKDVFHVLASEYDAASEVTVYCSFMQMYNERIFDLLVDGVDVGSGPSSSTATSSASTPSGIVAKASLAIREHGAGFQVRPGEQRSCMERLTDLIDLFID